MARCPAATRERRAHMLKWEKPSIRKADFAAQLGCACACGALAGAGSGHAN
ncbi:hypothetical protein GCM10029963_49180 [Micromonospora andamanensis]|uniref:Uncharacterized protein n=1 Tax=Micromonospora andamanensis TaxID=1287068 RepID=A0ABQ4HXV7_9ACTN|nr:hypothetical protein Van01_37070 [Micromonospora andamanensis]GIJ41468.1 hypothetical protein Vwe01_47930 [Micromonospora andamanensis]